MKSSNYFHDYGTSHAELCEMAISLAPKWRENAAASDEAKALSREAVAALHTSGLLKIVSPKKFGGFELGWPSLVEISRIASRQCASTGWTIALVGGHVITIGRFSHFCQAGVFAHGSDQLISSASMTRDGKITRVPGGLRLTGIWQYASSIDHANWVVVSGLVEDDRCNSEVKKIIVPMSKLCVLDTWNSVGMCASGSRNIYFEDVFIANEWVMSKADCFAKNPAGAAVNPHGYLYDVPLLPYSTSWIIGPILGCAEGALDEYISAMRIRHSSIAVSLSGTVADRLAESTAELTCAAHLYESICARLHSAGVARLSIAPQEDALIRRDRAYLAQLCISSVGRLVRQLSTSAFLSSNLIQRHWRDLQVMVSHIDINRDQAFASYSSGLLDSTTKVPWQR